MIRATELAHLLMRRTLKSGDWALDATVGNGHDTLFLAECVGATGRVYGFDIQAAALTAAKKRVDVHSQVTLIHAGHETMAEHVPGDCQLAGAMFNLGYLPGASREVMTGAETTIPGLIHALARLRTGGLLTLVIYPGHPGGQQEAATVRSFTQALGNDFSVTQYARINAARPAPELLAIERTG